MNLFSAFLLTYSFFETLKNQPQRINCRTYFFKTIYNRYIRLTPCYLIVLVVSGVVSSYLNDTSIFWLNDNNYEVNCKLYWWRNLLYIQNWWPFKEMCMNWSWYLATDFQLCVAACLLHVVYLKLDYLKKKLI